MARYKHIDTSPDFLPLTCWQQLPGAFEHALHHPLAHELDLSGFDSRFHKDATGAPAFPPAMLLKIIFLYLKTYCLHQPMPSIYIQYRPRREPILHQKHHRLRNIFRMPDSPSG